MKRLYWLLWIAFACLVWANPCDAHRGGLTISIPINPAVYACPQASQNWCIGSDGWTVFTPSSGTGACGNSSSTYTGTCIIAADNSTAASFTAHTTTNQLFIDSGTPPAVNQTITAAGIAAGTYILSGASSPFTLSASVGTIATEAMTSQVGNDTTCTADIAVNVGIVNSNSLSSFVPAKPCLTLGSTGSSGAQKRLRTGKPDWMVMKKGDSWVGGINGPTSDAWVNLNGKSVAEPMLISAYGSGVRPQMVVPAANDINCFSANAGNGGFIAIVGLWCYNPQFDPASGSFLGAAINADTGVANCGAATIICNINAGAGLPAFITGTNWWLDGSGINSYVASVSISAGATSVTMNNGAGFAATQMPIQITTRNSHGGISFDGETNLVILEDNRLDFGGIGLGQNTGIALQQAQYIVRRNMLVNSWDAIGGGSGGANVFSSDTYPNGVTSNLYEENLMLYGGWNPNVWAGHADVFSHSFYLHDPSVANNLTANIVAHGSVDDQWRDGGASYNNLFLYEGTALFMNTESNTNSATYDVIANASDLVLGNRTATAAATSGATLSINGALTALVGGGVTNLSNPGSISAATSVSAIASPTTVTLTGGTISAGIRGNGVQIGDNIQIWSGRGGGIQVGATGTYLSACTGCANGTFPGPSTVSVTAASPAIVMETGGASFGRPPNEPFQFTAGTLPTGLSLSTWYCSDTAAGTATAYPIYAATANTTSGQCNGGTDINTTGSNQSGISRTGTRLWSFTAAPFANWPWVGVPSWVTPGMNVYIAGATNVFPGSGGSTTVSSLPTSYNGACAGGVQCALVTTDASLVALQGVSGGTPQNTFSFNLPNNVYYPTTTIGPNELFINNKTNAVGSNGGAIQFQTLANGFKASNNYIYNWDYRGTANDLRDISQFPATNSITSAGQVLDELNFNDATKANVSIEAYDASIVNNSFTATISGAVSVTGYFGATLTVNSGTGPATGDTIFGASIPQYTVAISCSAGTCLLGNRWTAIANLGPETMTSGSADHFLSMASQQSKESGWDTRWTAKAANNFIRNAIGCTAGSTPACPQQNFLLKRDIDPASNDNSPMWLEKAA